MTMVQIQKIMTYWQGYIVGANKPVINLKYNIKKMLKKLNAFMDFQKIIN